MSSRAVASLLLASLSLVPVAASARSDVATPSELKPFNVTIRRYDPTPDAGRGHLFMLPVDSPDEEHAASSTLSNAIAFSRKTDGSKALPVAFTVVSVTRGARRHRFTAPIDDSYHDATRT